MKIWTITTSDDSGTATQAHTTEASARAQYARIVAASWESWFGESAAPMPDDTAKAWGVLSDQTGFLDTVTLEEHDITTHPAVREALAALELAQERLRMNDMDGEELPFIHDCAVAVALLTDAEPPQMDEATAAACTAEFGEE